MRKQPYLILSIATLLATVFTSAQAQSDSLVAAKVPFNFVIRDHALPAGEYLFSLIQVGASDAIKIQSADGHITAFVPTRSTKRNASQAETRLVFNRYGDQYFLSQVWGLGDSMQQVAKPRAEDRLVATSAEKKNVSVAAHKVSGRVRNH